MQFSITNDSKTNCLSINFFKTLDNIVNLVLVRLPFAVANVAWDVYISHHFYSDNFNDDSP